jgi:hypothetical protein
MGQRDFDGAQEVILMIEHCGVIYSQAFSAPPLDNLQ